MDTLINEVLKQLKEDINNEDLTAIEELLRQTPDIYLRAFLKEESNG